MMQHLAIAQLLCFAAAAAAEHHQFEFAAGGADAEWHPLAAIEQAALESGGHALDGAPLGAATAGLAALESKRPSFLRVRALRKAGQPASGYVVGSIPGCIVLDAGLHFDLALLLTPGSVLKAIEVRPHLAAGYAGCGLPAGHGGRAVAVPQTIGRILRIVPEDAYALPALVQAKGLAFPGQREVTESDVLLAAGSSVDPEQRAELQAKAAELERQAADANKTFLEKYWHFLLPIALYFGLQLLGLGGGGGEKPEAAAGSANNVAPAAAGRPHASAAGGGGRRS